MPNYIGPADSSRDFGVGFYNGSGTSASTARAPSPAITPSLGDLATRRPPWRVTLTTGVLEEDAGEIQPSGEASALSNEPPLSPSFSLIGPPYIKRNLDPYSAMSDPYYWSAQINASAARTMPNPSSSGLRRDTSLGFHSTTDRQPQADSAGPFALPSGGPLSPTPGSQATDHLDPYTAMSEPDGWSAQINASAAGGMSNPFSSGLRPGASMGLRRTDSSTIDDQPGISSSPAAEHIDFTEGSGASLANALSGFAPLLDAASQPLLTAATSGSAGSHVPTSRRYGLKEDSHLELMNKLGEIAAKRDIQVKKGEHSIIRCVLRHLEGENLKWSDLVSSDTTHPADLEKIVNAGIQNCQLSAATRSVLNRIFGFELESELAWRFPRH